MNAEKAKKKKNVWKSLIAGCDYGKIVPDDRIFVTEFFFFFFFFSFADGWSEKKNKGNAEKMHSFEATQLLNDTLRTALSISVRLVK